MMVPKMIAPGSDKELCDECGGPLAMDWEWFGTMRLCILCSPSAPIRHCISCLVNSIRGPSLFCDSCHQQLSEGHQAINIAELQPHQQPIADYLRYVIARIEAGKSPPLTPFEKGIIKEWGIEFVPRDGNPDHS